MDCTCPCQDGLALAYATQELQGDEDIVEAVPFYFSMGGRFQNFTHIYESNFDSTIIELFETSLSREDLTEVCWKRRKRGICSVSCRECCTLMFG